MYAQYFLGSILLKLGILATLGTRDYGRTRRHVRFNIYVPPPSQVIATVGAVLFVDRFGRKILLAASAFLMSISILALGVFFFLDERVKDCPEFNNVTVTAVPLCNFGGKYSPGRATTHSTENQSQIQF